MRLRMLSACLAVLALTASCDLLDRGSGTRPTDPVGGKGPVFVDSTEILVLESFPVQARLVVRGSLPTPCHEAVWDVEDRGRAIDVRLWSQADPARACVQVLEPFEVSIPLGSFEFATSPIVLNGEQVGRLAIGVEPAPGDAFLVGAGWSFGMCGGYCNADLVLAPEGLVLTGRSRMAAEPLYVNRGALTAVARERIEAAAASLNGVALKPVFGCPDCADGGAAYLVLARQGAISRHEMDFGRPPEVLAELHGLADALINALETCTSNELVAIAGDCAPWQGR